MSAGVGFAEWLRRVCEKLLERDPDIVEVIQFGSSVYAPEYARDVDLLVITGDPKDYDVYLDAVEDVAPPFNVDVVVVEVGGKLREDFVRSILGAFNILYGSGEHLLKYSSMLGDLTFNEARAALRAAKDYMGLARRAADELLRDRHIREAFDSLFHATRIAVMTYLSTEVSRWGVLRRMLPEPYSSRFKKFIDVLHIKYFYRGEYPGENVEGEFNRWYDEVEKFIEDLELEVKRRK